MQLPIATKSGKLVPLALVSDVLALPRSAVSVMNGVVMVTRLGEQPETLAPAVRIERAAKLSLRAIMSTALVAAIGFLPAAMATGTGAEVQRPLATVVIGGLVAAMILSLPALPTMLLLVARSCPAAREGA